MEKLLTYLSFSQVLREPSDQGRRSTTSVQSDRPRKLVEGQVGPYLFGGPE
jgi:hypothetical protein